MFGDSKLLVVIRVFVRSAQRAELGRLGVDGTGERYMYCMGWGLETLTALYTTFSFVF